MTWHKIESLKNRAEKEIFDLVFSDARIFWAKFLNIFFAWLVFVIGTILAIALPVKFIF